MPGLCFATGSSNYDHIVNGNRSGIVAIVSARIVLHFDAPDLPFLLAGLGIDGHHFRIQGTQKNGSVSIGHAATGV